MKSERTTLLRLAFMKGKQRVNTSASNDSRSYQAIMSRIGKFVALSHPFSRIKCSTVDGHKPDHENVDLDSIQFYWFEGINYSAHLVEPPRG